jgi:parvulin-like peptidyl-prolyl isomerase
LKFLLPLLIVSAVASARAEIIEQILVKVNGEIFTKSDLEQRQVAALRQKGQAIDLKSDPNNVQLRKALDDITPQLIVDAVDEMLIVQRGKELGYKLSDEQFKSVVDNIRKENKIESDEQFQAALKAENMTMADLRRNLERSMIVQRVQQNEVMSKIGVTDDEAKAYYEAHMNEFTSAPTVTLREILVSTPTDPKGINVGADEAALEKAQEIRRRVTTGGENFEKLAGEVSDSPSGSAQVDREDEAGRGQRTDSDHARIPAAQAGNNHRNASDVARAGAGADQRARLHRQAQGRIPEVHPEASRAGDHRVEESGDPQSVRRGREADSGGRGLGIGDWGEW